MRRLKAWLRRWLGVDAELERFSDAHTAAVKAVVNQLNQTTLGAANTNARLTYYENNVEVIKYHAQKLAIRGGKPNGRIHLLTDA